MDKKYRQPGWAGRINRSICFHAPRAAPSRPSPKQPPGGGGERCRWSRRVPVPSRPELAGRRRLTQLGGIALKAGRGWAAGSWLADGVTGERGQKQRWCPGGGGRAVPCAHAVLGGRRRANPPGSRQCTDGAIAPMAPALRSDWMDGFCLRILETYITRYRSVTVTVGLLGHVEDRTHT